MISDRGRARHDFSEIILDHKHEADDVLITMDAILQEYGRVRVSDLYDLVGITPNPIDDRWGWVNLEHARVRRVGVGYLIDVPVPIALDR